jgi:hypothetical protein
LTAENRGKHSPIRKLSLRNRAYRTEFHDQGEFPAPARQTLPDLGRSDPYQYRKPASRPAAKSPYFGMTTSAGLSCGPRVVGVVPLGWPVMKPQGRRRRSARLGFHAGWSGGRTLVSGGLLRAWVGGQWWARAGPAIRQLVDSAGLSGVGSATGETGDDRTYSLLLGSPF